MFPAPILVSMPVWVELISIGEASTIPGCAFCAFLLGNIESVSIDGSRTDACSWLMSCSEGYRVQWSSFLCISGVHRGNSALPEHDFGKPNEGHHQVIIENDIDYLCFKD
jgi:hypothetical protein